jgi:hypothetical protein
MAYKNRLLYGIVVSAVLAVGTTVHAADSVDAAQCGGWMTSRTVGGTPGLGSAIAEVRGVPGRAGEPLGNVESAMSRRTEPFLFPDAATGFRTACSPGATTVERWVWQDPPDVTLAGSYVLSSFPAPQFSDPPCLTNSHNQVGVQALSEFMGKSLAERMHAVNIFAELDDSVFLETLENFTFELAEKLTQLPELYTLLRAGLKAIEDFNTNKNKKFIMQGIMLKI